MFCKYVHSVLKVINFKGLEKYNVKLNGVTLFYLGFLKVFYCTFFR